MEMAKVTSKGQITIPVSIRRRLDIKEGDKILFIDRPEGVIMVNPDMLQGGAADEQKTGAPATAKPATQKSPKAPAPAAAKTSAPEVHIEQTAPAPAVHIEPTPVVQPAPPPPVYAEPTPVAQPAPPPSVYAEPTPVAQPAPPPPVYAEPTPVAQPAPPPPVYAEPAQVVRHTTPTAPIQEPMLAEGVQPVVEETQIAGTRAAHEIIITEPEKPAKQVQGLDLNALLNEIRSIGSNI